MGGKVAISAGSGDTGGHGFCHQISQCTSTTYQRIGERSRNPMADIKSKALILERLKADVHEKLGGNTASCCDLDDVVNAILEATATRLAVIANRANRPPLMMGKIGG